MTNIKDKDVSRAIQTLIDEFTEKEAQIEDFETSESDLFDQIVTLEGKIDNLNDRIKELEEALAEAYLTSEVKQESIKETCNESSPSQTSTED